MSFSSDSFVFYVLMFSATRKDIGVLLVCSFLPDCLTSWPITSMSFPHDSSVFYIVVFGDEREEISVLFAFSFWPDCLISCPSSDVLFLLSSLCLSSATQENDLVYFIPSPFHLHIDICLISWPGTVINVISLSFFVLSLFLAVQ